MKWSILRGVYSQTNQIRNKYLRQHGKGIQLRQISTFCAVELRASRVLLNYIEYLTSMEERLAHDTMRVDCRTILGIMRLIWEIHMSREDIKGRVFIELCDAGSIYSEKTKIVYCCLRERYEPTLHSVHGTSLCRRVSQERVILREVLTQAQIVA